MRRNLSILEQLMVSGTQFVLMLALARFWGMEALGRFSLVLMVAMLAMDLFRSVVTQPLLSRKKNYNHRQHVTTLLLMTGALLLCLLLCLSGAYLLATHLMPQWGLKSLYLAGLCFITGRVLSDVMRGVAYGYQKPYQALVMSAVISAISLTAMLWLIVTREHLHAGQALWVLGGAHLVGVAVFFRYVPLTCHVPQLREILQMHCQFGGWMALTAIMRWLQGNWLMLVTGSVLGLSVLGAIRAMQSLVSPLGVVLQMMENMLPPQATKMFQSQGNKALIHFLQRYGLQIGAILFLAIAVLWLLQRWIIPLLIGAEYLDYGYLIPLIGGAMLLSVVNLLFSFYLKTHHATRPLFVAHALNAVLCLVLCWPLVTYGGMAGYALGLILFQLVLIGNLWRAVRHVQPKEGKCQILA